MFGPRVLEEVESKYSGKLVDKNDWGNKYVSTGVLTQAGGLVKDVWHPVFKKISKKDRTWLILGLATGTIASMIPDPKKIIGVEIDPMMIEIGKKYFNLAKIKNLEIVNKDARNYLRHTDEIFDFVLVDMYLGDKMPEFVYTLQFIGKIRKIARIAVFNHLFYDADKKAKAGKLVKLLETCFNNVALVRVLSNVMLLCSNS